jgi:hypothetical protein
MKTLQSPDPDMALTMTNTSKRTPHLNVTQGEPVFRKESPMFPHAFAYSETANLLKDINPVR